jgi:UDP-N-acetylglucosamine diphosphorylase/glucosamine-1-phosphate N-acetyltransferase
MNLILFDAPEDRTKLLPFTFTRPLSYIRIGALTIKEKWEIELNTQANTTSEAYFNHLFGFYDQEGIYVRSSVLPNNEFLKSIQGLTLGQALVNPEGTILAAYMSKWGDFDYCQKILFQHSLFKISELCDIFLLNKTEISQDILRLKTPPANTIADLFTASYNLSNIFIEEGVQIKAAILNAEEGPILLRKGAHIHEGSILKGPCVIGEDTHVGMGTKIRGNVSTGPNCAIGGEIKDSVFFGNSNKGHDGYMGNSVIGEWCNLGANTITSNIKNTFGPVSLYSFESQKIEKTDILKCGTFMGDYSSTGINTQLNTATIIGICSSLHEAGIPPKYTPSFSWGTEQKLDLEKGIEIISRFKTLKENTLTEGEVAMIRHLYKEEHTLTV